MSIFNDIDPGPSHPWPTPQTGQATSTGMVAGSGEIVWSTGSMLEKHPAVAFGVSAWRGIGGQLAGSSAALALLVRQLEELGSNRDLQPVNVQWTSTAFGGGVLNAPEQHDGWYYLANMTPDYSTLMGGFLVCKVDAFYVGPYTFSRFAVGYSGGQMSSSYSATPTPMISFPIGATLPPATASTRTGAEGAIPISVTTLTGVNPAPVVRPPTIAGLFTGVLKVFDTMNTGTNPVPSTATVFVDPNWVQVYGTKHVWAGDCVVTNGLWLLLFQVGQPGAPKVYFWNTSLGSPAWQYLGDIEYQDNSANVGTLREVALETLGWGEVRVRVVLSTSAGNYAKLRYTLPAGGYGGYVDFIPQTQTNTSLNALSWTIIGGGTYATGFTESTSSTTFPSNLATTAVSGYAGVQAAATASPIFGWFYQNTPTNQGRLASTTIFGLGDSAGPAQGVVRRYGFWMLPTTGAPSVATDRTLVAPLFAQWLFRRTARWNIA